LILVSEWARLTGASVVDVLGDLERMERQRGWLVALAASGRIMGDSAFEDWVDGLEGPVNGGDEAIRRDCDEVNRKLARLGCL
jgi:hypothetical protein